MIVLLGVFVVGVGRNWLNRQVQGTVGNQTSGVDVGKKPPQPAQQPPAVTIEVVKAGVFRQYIALSGTVEASTVAVLASPAEGPVLHCAVREGDRVRAGQAVVRIGRQDSALASRSSAAEELRRQQEEYRRIVTLVEAKALPADQLDLAKSSLERAKAAMIQANQAAGDYVVTAPWDGIVSQVRVSDGNFVAPRAPLVDIYDPASLVLRFSVAEDQAFTLKTGSKVLASFDGLGGKEYELEIVRAFPGLDKKLRTRTFEAGLPKEDFIPGMFARIRAVLKEDPSALTVPVDAVQTQGGKRSVFVVRDGLATRRTIEVGFEQDGRIAVRSGLDAGDQVVVGGIERVKDGVPVRLKGAEGLNKNATGEARS
ncbi:efflux RND transporter periplasmic adaptor subunit [Thermodesulfomicrobium sp. WS]|uniref:efflux RND transporter periplasmic adaptor subunit n=1 Tax=Thermodesulfomicrobium sp. WS TaxID=3004129 RepID=UPI0024915223|nr:efflux RND transporter periplasmic adaptor subunit [Thermodesulfomicrobium sp. WS]